jgi:protein-arginine kinase activator protein McsA
MRDKRQLTESDITKHTWGFEWDDVRKAARELEAEEFGTPSVSQQHCWECGEIKSDEQNDGHLEYCPFCGTNYKEAKQSRRYLASVIDVVYPLWSAEERAEYHSVVKVLRSVNPEFRAMWEEETNKAALGRRYANG